jgi:hypothetical protein
MAAAHGGSHHPEPGYGIGADFALSQGFHHYDHQNYGQNRNIWCDGKNQQLSQHHRGNTVKADLPAGSSFVGGFCMKSEITPNGTLTIGHNGLVGHDKVWLLSAVDGSYYPIDKPAQDNSILVRDGSWSDTNPESGYVEADVLLSASGSGNSTGTGDAGGGCNSGALAFMPLFTAGFICAAKVAR